MLVRTVFATFVCVPETRQYWNHDLITLVINAPAPQELRQRSEAITVRTVVVRQLVRRVLPLLPAYQIAATQAANRAGPYSIYWKGGSEPMV